MSPTPLPSLPLVDAETVLRTLPWAAAVDALELALLDGLDPAAAAARTVVDVDHGQLLLMPAQTEAAVGVKLASVAPGNPARSLPRIQAVYLLLDHDSLSPLALLDGTALTTLRTPAMSAVAVRHLAVQDAHRLVVFGSGPQAWGHVQAIRAVRPVDEVIVVGRDRGRAEDLAHRLSAEQVPGRSLTARVGDAGAVADADVVVCATTAGEPVFDGRLVPGHACVVAVGSHEPDRRELDAALLGRASIAGGVVVEDRDTALREAGDVVLAVADGALEPSRLVDVAAAVRRTRGRDALSVFKSVGMGWQDLVVARAVYDRL